MNSEKEKTTHFGYQVVTEEKKAGMVRDVFDSVATKYDVMNDLMSAGLHRLWKKFTISLAAVKPGQVILDLAGGTGDLTEQLIKKVGKNGHVILSDINASMLKEGRSRLINSGESNKINILQLDAQKLPFNDSIFDSVMIAFGLRNVTDKEAALASMYRVLKPGGKVMILEFSKPNELIKPAYDFYSFNILPILGKLVANDSKSYQYLAESIRMHPDQETLRSMMEKSGFKHNRFHNMAAGIVALHIGYKV